MAPAQSTPWGNFHQASKTAIHNLFLHVGILGVSLQLWQTFSRALIQGHVQPLTWVAVLTWQWRVACFAEKLIAAAFAAEIVFAVAALVTSLWENPAAEDAESVRNHQEEPAADAGGSMVNLQNELAADDGENLQNEPTVDVGESVRDLGKEPAADDGESVRNHQEEPAVDDRESECEPFPPYEEPYVREEGELEEVVRYIDMKEEVAQIHLDRWVQRREDTGTTIYTEMHETVYKAEIDYWRTLKREWIWK
ncbi:hypothetical protein MMC30_009421 [Trapelia coarctata]|nr:hypothetical protein [Trapelia coarctata]